LRKEIGRLFAAVVDARAESWRLRWIGIWAKAFDSIVTKPGSISALFAKAASAPPTAAAKRIAIARETSMPHTPSTTSHDKPCAPLLRASASTKRKRTSPQAQTQQQPSILSFFANAKATSSSTTTATASIDVAVHATHQPTKRQRTVDHHEVELVSD
jgi:hypothetical protein